LKGGSLAFLNLYHEKVHTPPRYSPAFREIVRKREKVRGFVKRFKESWKSAPPLIECKRFSTIYATVANFYHTR